MTNGVSRLAALGLAVLVVGCTDLDSIDAGVCGNGVIEGAEDCDGGGTCGTPGSKSQCRFICEEPDLKCQSGWVCGNDSVCREPTGTFRTGDVLVADGQLELQIGEFNAADPADLLTVAFSGEIAVRYGGNALSEISRFKSSPFLPAFGHLDSGPTDDIVHITGDAVGVLLGSSDGTLRPMAYSPIPVAGDGSRFLMLEAKLPANEGEVRYYALDEILEIEGNEIRDAFAQGPAAVAKLPFDASELMPPPDLAETPVGQLDESPASPCEELVLLRKQAKNVIIYSPCKLNGVAWNDNVLALPVVSLPPGGSIGIGGTLADLDGDAHLDLFVLGPEDKGSHDVYLAFGAGDGTFNSTLPAVKGATDNKAVLFDMAAPGMPLAAGDFTGDGRADFVFSGLALTTKPNCPKVDSSCYDERPLPGTFIQARIADFNVNGKADVVAISGKTRAVYFFNGTGSPLLNLFEVPTVGYPSSLAIGDFDGDLVRDVAVIERLGGDIGPTSGSGRNGGSACGIPAAAPAAGAFSVLFGTTQGAPQAPVRMGELAHIEGMAAGHLAVQGLDKMTDVGVLGCDQSGVRSVAVFNGASNRQMQSPFGLTAGPEDPDIPIAVQVGRFAAAEPVDIAALALDSARKPRLWMIPATGEAALSVSTTRVSALPENVDPCNATLLPIDLDADATDELVIVAHRAAPKASSGTLLMVARAKSDTGSVAWKFDPVVELADFTLSNHPIARSQCRERLKLLQQDDKGLLGRVEVGNLDGAGAEELVLLSFVVSGSAASEKLESKLVVFMDGKLDAASRVDIELPPNIHPMTFTLLNADKDPELELAYFAPEGTFLADLDVSARTLTNLATLRGAPPGTEEMKGFGANAPINLAAGDLNGDGMPDLAMGFLFSTELFYGVPVKQ